ncbi:MlaC/ttg2D family ABC transporter substrate-binding protein [Candidatus Pandoraea novymonadis]|uniref:Phospholipid-binding protein MlaC n=1 Tax=Candidatus Pandoraea novymonadis TaxID=1808959 RepID=A0ABX5FEC1_9BURK|nr:ABC transporter substrate-binding protein [Candidatus Pandoraea novymonadis]PSB91572.1 putative phospholipid-binding protein MlaC [Candidatus Pandoraea novymonadis]
MTKRFLDASIVVFMVFFGIAAVAHEMQAPDALVKQTVREILVAAKTDLAFGRGDLDQITTFVEKRIMPQTDFERATKLAMGRNWQLASKSQQQQITEQFKHLLVRTYSGVIAQIRDQQVFFKSYRGHPSDMDAVIYTEVLNNSQPIQINYRLTKTPVGWKVYDINVMGAWLIEAYRGQFAAKVNSGGVDGLINFLVDCNQRFLSGK